jgi:hypothetical protein
MCLVLLPGKLLLQLLCLVLSLLDELRHHRASKAPARLNCPEG